MLRIKCGLLYNLSVISLLLGCVIFTGCGNTSENNQQKIIEQTIQTTAAADTRADTENYSDNIPETIDNSVPEPYYDLANRTSVSKAWQEGNFLYYSNVFDDGKLYRYDFNTDEDVLMTDQVIKAAFISIAGQKIYFTGSSADNANKYNIYSVDKNGGGFQLEIENAKGALVTDEYIYYHDSYDDFAMEYSGKK